MKTKLIIFAFFTLLPNFLFSTEVMVVTKPETSFSPKISISGNLTFQSEIIELLKNNGFTVNKFSLTDKKPMARASLKKSSSQKPSLSDTFSDKRKARFSD